MHNSVIRLQIPKLPNLSPLSPILQKKTPRRSTPGSLEIRCRIDRGAYFFRPAKCFLGFLASLPLQPLQQTATETVDLTAASTSLPLTGPLPVLGFGKFDKPSNRILVKSGFTLFAAERNINARSLAAIDSLALDRTLLVDGICGEALGKGHHQGECNEANCFHVVWLFELS